MPPELKTAWVRPRAAGRLAPRRPPRPPYPNPDSVKHERLFRLPGSSRAHVGADTSMAFSARSAAPAAPRRSAAARWCCRAPIRIRRYHALAAGTLSLANNQALGTGAPTNAGSLARFRQRRHHRRSDRARTRFCRSAPGAPTVSAGALENENPPAPCSPPARWARPRSTPAAFSRRARPAPPTHDGSRQAGTDRGGVLSECAAQILRPDRLNRRRSRSDGRARVRDRAQDQRQGTPGARARAQGAQSAARTAKLNDIAPQGRLAGYPRATTASSGEVDCRSPSRKLASKTLRPKLIDPAHFSETRVGFTRCGCHHSSVRS